jgi:hypothetical protein
MVKSIETARELHLWYIHSSSLYVRRKVSEKIRKSNLSIFPGNRSWAITSYAMSRCAQARLDSIDRTPLAE